MESLSTRQARKLVLLSQRLPTKKQLGTAEDATLSAVEHLGYIQIDTISAIQRAHHHTLWNRNSRYKPSHLDKLTADKRIFEYWSHAAAYLPMRDYRYTLPRKHDIACGELDHWYGRNEQLMKMVCDRIAAEGPLMAKDFRHAGEKAGEWESRPAKQALEHLFMQGDLMISSRHKFHKVYDLTRRVLPSDIDTTMPTSAEWARFLIIRYLEANGFGQASEICYLRKGIKPFIGQTLDEMRLSGELLQLRVGDRKYYALPTSLELLNNPLSRSKVKILSPFDNLLIQRQRTKEIFDFDYLLECYLPEAKRQFGYFSLPILWGGELVARMDCRTERKKSLLHIHHLAIEPSLKNIENFSDALLRELSFFMKFNLCTQFELHRVTPRNAIKFDCS